ncbi:MAG: transporter substrate-binding domain-containing protein [Pseudomonadota bacterium]
MWIRSLLAALACAAFLVSPVAGLELRAVSADLPPYSIQAERSGFNHELAVLAAERAGHTLSVEYVPWKRAQKIVMAGPDYLTFNMTRTEAREPLYKWIAPIVRINHVFVSKDLPINSMAEAAGGRIVSRSGTPQLRRLLNEGMTPIEVERTAAAVQMVNSGRAHGWFTHDRRALWAWKRYVSDDPPAIGAPLGGGVIYMAASHGFPDDVAMALQVAMEELRADGSYDALMIKYFGQAD